MDSPTVTHPEPVPAATAVAAPRISVLFAPITPAAKDIPRALCDQVTDAIAGEAQHVAGFTIVTMAALEGVATQETLRQSTGCDALSCYTDLAGALNAQQLVMGKLGRLGTDLTLTLTRVRTQDAQLVGMASMRFPVGGEQQLLDQAPAIVASLFGVPVASLDTLAKRTPLQVQEREDRIREANLQAKRISNAADKFGALRTGLRIAAGVVGVGSAVLAVLGTAAAAACLGVLGFDFGAGYRPENRTHRITIWTYLAGWGAGIGAAVGLVAAVALAAPAVTAIVISLLV